MIKNDMIIYMDDLPEIIPDINDLRNKIVVGHVLDVLARIPNNSISCVFSSPPYYGVRNYGIKATRWAGNPTCQHVLESIDGIRKATPGDVPGPGSLINSHRPVEVNRPGEDSSRCTLCGAWFGQFGLEPTLQQYIQNSLLVTREIYRVLRDDGALWWNIGDTYSKSGGAGGDWNHGSRALEPKWRQGESGLPTKCAMQVPSRVSIAMTDQQGWILRNENIWRKKSPMPESVRDRFTRSHEKVFFYVKNVSNPLYYYNEKTGALVSAPPDRFGTKGIDWDQVPCGACQQKGCQKCGETGYVQHTWWASRDYYFNQQFTPLKVQKGGPFGGNKAKGYGKGTYSGKQYDPSNLVGAIQRDVLDVSTSRFKGGHYATYPIELPAIGIRATCPEHVCTTCNRPWQPLYHVEGRLNASWHDHEHDNEQGAGQTNGTRSANYKNYKKWRNGHARCDCKAPTQPGIVLDVFGGVGHTALAALENNVDFILIELKKEYAMAAAEQIASWIKQGEPPVPTPTTASLESFMKHETGGERVDG